MQLVKQMLLVERLLLGQTSAHPQSTSLLKKVGARQKKTESRKMAIEKNKWKHRQQKKYGKV